MIKKSHVKCNIPLSEKIKVLGTRVETSNNPQYKIEDEKIKIFDNWNIQIIYIPLTDEQQNPTPLLLQHNLSWEEEYDWNKNYTTILSINYKRKPQSNSIHIYENNTKLQLSLFLEAILELDLSPLSKTISKNINESNNNHFKTEKNETASIEKKLVQLEEAIINLNNKNAELEKNLLNILKTFEKDNVFCKIEGRVMDSFRMLPIPKAILEFYTKDSDTPIIKLTTDNQGNYSSKNLKPGVYELRIKRGRYLPLIVKNYVLNEGEQKNQDFLLRIS